MYMRLLILCFSLAGAGPLFLPAISHGHDEPLDVYGCHYDADHKYYHCHRGVYMRLSFDSKTQMIQRLRNQHIALGHPWHYGDAANDYEQHIASSNLAKIEPKAGLRDAPKQKREAVYSRINQSPRPTAVKQPFKTMEAKSSRPSKTAPDNNQVAQPTPTERQRSTLVRKPTEPELKVWITKIRSDGRPIFESVEGEHFVLDDSGNKVVVGRPDL